MQSTIQDLREEARCGICLDIWKNPEIISCGHIYCKECLDTVIDFGRQNNAVVTCPLRCCTIGLRMSVRNLTKLADIIKMLKYDFEIRRILDYDGNIYLVDWAPSWEHSEDLRNCDSLIEEFENLRLETSRPSSSRLRTTPRRIEPSVPSSATAPLDVPGLPMVQDNRARVPAPAGPPNSPASGNGEPSASNLNWQNTEWL